jgi:hypothetical protein
LSVKDFDARIQLTSHVRYWCGYEAEADMPNISTNFRCQDPKAILALEQWGVSNRFRTTLGSPHAADFVSGAIERIAGN